MSKTFFISDLHLSPSEPQTINLFLKFIDYCIQQNIDNLYILGDFFNYWIGNDKVLDWHQPIIQAFEKLGRTAKIYFLVGNRDFLINQQTCATFGFILIPEDLRVINLYGTDLVILHGDTLCTLDTKYQTFRKLIRTGIFKKLYLALPQKIRNSLAEETKKKSLNRSDYIANPAKYDVVLESINQVFKATGTDIMVHGHTHQPNVHAYENQGTTQCRYVLGDWHGNGAYFLEVSNTNSNKASFDLRFFTTT